MDGYFRQNISLISTEFEKRMGGQVEKERMRLGGRRKKG